LLLFNCIFGTLVKLMKCQVGSVSSCGPAAIVNATSLNATVPYQPKVMQMRHLITTPRTSFNRVMRRFMQGGLLAAVAVAAIPAAAGTYDGALSRTRYVQLTGDVNGDGLNDVLMKAVPTNFMIPLDDLSVPISIAPASPSFVLLSSPYGQYSLVTSPDGTMVANGAWRPGNQPVSFSGPSGDLAGSVTIGAASADQTSFVVSMGSTGQLQIATLSLPLPQCD
jgi:hypothetical protein